MRRLPGEATRKPTDGARPDTRRGLDLEKVSDRIALAVGSTASFYAHLLFYGGLFALRLAGVPFADILLLVATLVSLEGVFLVIFVQRSANQQARRLEEAITVIRHNTADHLSEPLDVVVKDIRRELYETAARVGELAESMQRLLPPPPSAAAQEAAALNLPALVAREAAANGADGTGGADGAGGAIDVVVVDDDVAICDLVRDVLGDAGYSVLAATSGIQAMALLAIRQPRLILADLDMPAMSGWALSAWLRAHESLRDVPVVLISGSAQIAREATLLGAQGYVAKPFDVDHLVRVIDTQLMA